MLASTLFHILSFANVETPITRCSDNSPLPLSYNYENCSEIICCKIGGTTELFSFTFVTNQHVSRLQLQLRAVTINDIYTVTDYPSPEPNACSSLTNASCPLNAGQIVSYSSRYIAPVFSEPMVGIAEARMVDQDNNTLCCLVHVLKILTPGQKCGKNLTNYG